MSDPHRRVAIVTGGAGGIGAAIARRLSAEGNTVVAADITEDSAGPGSFSRLDVTDAGAWRRVVSEVAGRHGRLDVLVNAAGIQGEVGHATLAECTKENWERVLSVNLTGAFLGCQAALPAMSDGGAIVNVSSLASFYPTEYNVAYGVSKGGLTQLTKTVAAAAAPRVRCNSVHPGVIATPMIDQILEATAAAPDRKSVV